MANFYYQSDDLGKVLYLSDVERLSVSELNTLKKELEEVTSDIKSQMYQQRDTADFDKIHAMSLKINICHKFLLRIKRALAQPDTGKVDLASYHLAFFRQAVDKELGKYVTDELYEEARSQALLQAGKESWQ